ncbi:hypothetical protein IWZ00DRAFT_257579 [Phyllosticta capitalensis]
MAIPYIWQLAKPASPLLQLRRPSSWPLEHPSRRCRPAGTESVSRTRLLGSLVPACKAGGSPAMFLLSGVGRSGLHDWVAFLIACSYVGRVDWRGDTGASKRAPLCDRPNDSQGSTFWGSQCEEAGCGRLSGYPNRRAWLGWLWQSPGRGLGGQSGRRAGVHSRQQVPLP